MNGSSRSRYTEPCSVRVVVFRVTCALVGRPCERRVPVGITRAFARPVFRCRNDNQRMSAAATTVESVEPAGFQRFRYVVVPSSVWHTSPAAVGGRHTIRSQQQVGCGASSVYEYNAYGFSAHAEMFRAISKYCTTIRVEHTPKES